MIQLQQQLYAALPVVDRFVYLCQSDATGVLKPGSTNDLRRRAREHDMRLISWAPGSRADEDELHRSLRRIPGAHIWGELYHPLPAVLATIAVFFARLRGEEAA